VKHLPENLRPDVSHARQPKESFSQRGQRLREELYLIFARRRLQANFGEVAIESGNSLVSP